MTISPLLPIAGAAVGSLAADVAEGIHKSFADVLQRVVSTSDTTAAESERLQANTESLDGGRANAPDDETLEEFKRVLTEQLRAAGIDLSEPLRLRGDGYGRLVVEGDHPDRTKIEELLRDDMTLAVLFNELAAKHRPLQAQQTLDQGGPDPFDFSVTIANSAIELHFADPDR